MFKWLTGLLTGRRRKETEIRQLKQERAEYIEKCKTAALHGDQDATLKLNNFKQTLDEQSIKFLKNPAK